MTLTVDILNTWFRQFNADYFGGELPVPTLELSKARTRLGMMSCKWKMRMLKRVYTDFKIRVSIYYDCTEREYQETLLHEMIHYYIAYKGIRDTSSHGPAFCEIMHRLNSEYGWNISITSSMREHSVSKTIAAKVGTYIVLAIKHKNGKYYLSVVNLRSVSELDGIVKKLNEVVEHRWYVTHDEYFRRFTKVRTLKAKCVPMEVFNEKTAAMQPLEF